MFVCKKGAEKTEREQKGSRKDRERGRKKSKPIENAKMLKTNRFSDEWSANESIFIVNQ